MLLLGLVAVIAGLFGWQLFGIPLWIPGIVLIVLGYVSYYARRDQARRWWGS